MTFHQKYPGLRDENFVPFAEYLWSNNDEIAQRALYLSKVSNLDDAEKDHLDDTLRAVAKYRRSQPGADPLKDLCITQLVKSPELISTGEQYGFYVVAAPRAIKLLKQSAIEGAREVANTISRVASNKDIFPGFSKGWIFRVGPFHFQIMLSRPKT
jgi:hypothetical protein